VDQGWLEDDEEEPEAEWDPDEDDEEPEAEYDDETDDEEDEDFDDEPEDDEGDESPGLELSGGEEGEGDLDPVARPPEPPRRAARSKGS